MTNEYKVSVIIPAYNNASTIADAVRSALAQTLTPLEVIVVNDGSTDETASVLAQFGGAITVIENPANIGQAASRNAAIKRACGGWIAFLDGDDTWQSDKLEKQTAFLRANPSLKWCGTNYSILRDDGSEQLKTSSMRDAIGGYFSLMEQGEVSGSTITLIISRELLERAGLFSEKLRRNEDIELFWRMALIEPQYGWLAEPLSRQRMSAGSGESMRLRVMGKDGRYLAPVLDKCLAISRGSETEKEFRAYASRILRNAMLSMAFLSLREPLARMLRRFGSLLSPFWRLLLWQCAVLPFSGLLIRFACWTLAKLGASVDGRNFEYWSFIKQNGFPDGGEEK